ncbi:Hypothetical protein ORPV_577 [Orpheovirus IHUMI-LCC2]|uniref:Uncharacterized protein n=1 Tax=Orpheovirus IHUMI-LCC2 TaxID=2023057 RepID=A0A2I2L4P6_9VIRU|nr:Hypothetical protein ORPV_577 [Orpheovirus IHUMI-LCC2]SNW62481.1 Hypothetical protein ORPV_577 [Orpheovirus IHUMI-LCC2]
MDRKVIDWKEIKRNTFDKLLDNGYNYDNEILKEYGYYAWTSDNKNKGVYIYEARPVTIPERNFHNISERCPTTMIPVKMIYRTTLKDVMKISYGFTIPILVRIVDNLKEPTSSNRQELLDWFDYQYSLVVDGFYA